MEAEFVTCSSFFRNNNIVFTTSRKYEVDGKKFEEFYDNSRYTEGINNILIDIKESNINVISINDSSKCEKLIELCNEYCKLIIKSSKGIRYLFRKSSKDPVFPDINTEKMGYSMPKNKIISSHFKIVNDNPKLVRINNNIIDIINNVNSKKKIIVDTEDKDKIVKNFNDIKDDVKEYEEMYDDFNFVHGTLTLTYDQEKNKKIPKGSPTNEMRSKRQKWNYFDNMI